MGVTFVLGTVFGAFITRGVKRCHYFHGTHPRWPCPRRHPQRKNPVPTQEVKATTATVPISADSSYVKQ